MVNVKSFEVVMQKEKDGGYSAYVPSLPGCISQGETKAETLKNIQEAIELYLEDLSEKELAELQARIFIVKTKIELNA